METTRKDQEEVQVENGQTTNGQPANGQRPPILDRTFKPDPPAGRKLSREEALDYVLEKNQELLRRLA